MTDDKAVSTEDLFVTPRNASVEAARLEAVIKILIENKVETLKNAKRKSSSLTSSPQGLLFNKLKGNSTSTVSSPKDFSSPKRPRKTTAQKHAKSLQFSDEDCDSETCYCHKEPPIDLHDEEFIALNIDDCCESLDAATAEEEIAARKIRHAARKKRRRRRRKRAAKPLHIAVIPAPDFKGLDEDELSKRARVTIILTACLLLFMCLLLVGITLRMAPLIDDMVRKENEELMNALGRESERDSLQNATASVPVILK